MTAPAPESNETRPAPEPVPGSASGLATDSASGSAAGLASGDYRVRLEAFDGPLDLLLYLIRRAEVDIHDVPIAQITDQYVAYLSNVERIDIELAGEFLVMAATLMEIKARLLGNACQTDSSQSSREAHVADADADAGDPRADLIKQLLDYKAYRDAATGLENQLEQWSQRFPAAKAKADTADAQPVDYDLDDLNIIDLVQAFADICTSVNFDRLGEHEVSYDDTPIELHAADIVDRLRRREGADVEGHIPLVAIFRDKSRSEMIGLFMAMLELCRQCRIRVRQRDSTGEITVCLGDEFEPAVEPAVEVASEAAPNTSDDQGETIDHTQRVTASEPSPASDGS